MTNVTIALTEYRYKLGLEPDHDFLQESLRLMSRMLMELEVQTRTGAAKHERTPERLTQCQFSPVNAPLLFGNTAPALFGRAAPPGERMQRQSG